MNPSARPGAAIPWLCGITHVAAAAWTALLLRDGLHGAPLARVAFIDAHPTSWRIGWVLWMTAALSFVAFVGSWAARVRGPLSVVAFLVSVLGLASDLAADSIYVGWTSTRGARAFELGHFLSFVVAHGAYVAAGALLTFVDRSMPVGLRRTAWVNWALGTAAGLSVLLPHETVTEVLFGLTFVLLVPWTVAFGRTFTPSRGRAVPGTRRGS